MNNQDLEILKDFEDPIEAQTKLEALGARNRGLKGSNREMRDEMEVSRPRDAVKNEERATKG